MHKNHKLEVRSNNEIPFLDFVTLDENRKLCR